MPESIFTSVDFPAPFSPISAVTAPRRSSRLALSSARTPPNDLRMSVSVRREGCTESLRRSSENLRELSRVAEVVDEWLAHRTHAVLPEGDLAHAAHVHGLRRIVTARETRGDLHRGVAEIDGIPDGKFGHDAFFDVTHELRRQPQAGDLHLAGQALIFHGTRRGHDSDRADADQHREIRVLLEQRHGFAIRLVGNVVAVNHTDEFETRMSGECLTHFSEPGILVRGSRCRRNNRELAFPLSIHLRRELRRQCDDGFTDELVGRWREMRDAAGRVDTRVIGNHLDATRHGPLERGHQCIGVIRGDRDRVDALRDQGIQHFDLTFCGGCGGARENDFRVEFLARFVGAFVDGVEEAVAKRLRHNSHASFRRFFRLGLAAAGKAREEHRHTGDQKSEIQLEPPTRAQASFFSSSSSVTFATMTLMPALRKSSSSSALAPSSVTMVLMRSRPATIIADLRRSLELSAITMTCSLRFSSLVCACTMSGSASIMPKRLSP